MGAALSVEVSAQAKGAEPTTREYTIVEGEATVRVFEVWLGEGQAVDATVAVVEGEALHLDGTFVSDSAPSEPFDLPVSRGDLPRALGTLKLDAGEEWCGYLLADSSDPRPAAPILLFLIRRHRPSP